MVALQEDDLWRALASPVRRRILDLLKSGPRSTGELAVEFPDLSRFAVMQHLGVLEEASLLLVRRRGRQRFNFLNAVPLQELYDRWVGRFAGEEAHKAVALKRYVEEGDTGMQMEKTSSARAVRIETEIKFNAKPERVFAAMTTEQGNWYPHTYGGDRVKSIVFEEKVGGICYEDWGGGTGKLYGTVTWFDPPRAFSLRGDLRGGISMEHWYVVEPAGKGCVLKGSLTCFGDISDDEEIGIREHGDLTKYEDVLRAYVEKGGEGA